MRGLGYIVATVLVTSFMAGSILRATNNTAPLENDTGLPTTNELEEAIQKAVDDGYVWIDGSNAWAGTNVYSNLYLGDDLVSWSVMTNSDLSDRATALYVDAKLDEGFKIYIEGAGFTNVYVLKSGELVKEE